MSRDRERGEPIAWNRETTVKLINLLKYHRCLWDLNAADYNDRSLREDALRRMTNALRGDVAKLTKLDVRSKIASLRSQYRKQLRQLQVRNEDNTGYIKKKPTLWCYDYLQFLRPMVEIRRTLAGVETITPDPIGEVDDELDAQPEMQENVSYTNEGEDTMDAMDDSGESLPKDVSLTIEIDEKPQLQDEEIETEIDETLYSNPPIKRDLSQVSSSSCIQRSSFKSKNNSRAIEKELQSLMKTLQRPKRRYEWLAEQMLETFEDIDNEDLVDAAIMDIQRLLMEVKATNRHSKKSKTLQYIDKQAGFQSKYLKYIQ